MLMGIFRLGENASPSAAPFFFLTPFLAAFSLTLVGNSFLARILAIASSEVVASISSLTSCPEVLIAVYVKTAMLNLRYEDRINVFYGMSSEKSPFTVRKKSRQRLLWSARIFVGFGVQFRLE